MVVRFRMLSSSCAVLALVTTIPVASARADPVYPSAGQVRAAKAAVGDKAAQIAVVEGRLKVSNARLVEVRMAAEVANEKYNLARLLLQQRTVEAAAAGKRADAAQKAADLASDKLGHFAAATYMQGGNLGQLEAFLSSKGPQEVLDRAAGIQLITDIRNGIMQDADASSVVAGVLRRLAARAQAQQLAAQQVAESARVAAQAQVDLAAAETVRIQREQGAMIAQLATLRNTSVALERARQSGLKAESDARAAAARKAAVQARAAQARRVAKAAAAARASAAKKAARRSPTPSQTPDRTSPPSPSTERPPRGGVSAVIAFAEAQVGDPYLWGAAGPDSWDCSGLTMMAWAQAGVNISHYTGWQWAETSRVDLADLRPGDLVFYGDSGPTSHHMGLYIGGDMMINAPHTGANVRYDNIYSFGNDLLPYGGRP